MFNRLIFDMNNPNFTILNKIDKIARMLIDVPVLKHESENNEIIGCICKVTKIDREKGLIYGDIVGFHNDNLDIGDMKNYMVDIEDFELECMYKASYVKSVMEIYC